MKNRGEILKAWLMTVWRAALAMACMPAMFVGVHMLAGGQLREVRYALLLCAAVMLAAAAWSLNSSSNFFSIEPFCFATKQPFPATE